MSRLLPKISGLRVGVGGPNNHAQFSEPPEVVADAGGAMCLVQIVGAKFLVSHSAKQNVVG